MHYLWKLNVLLRWAFLFDKVLVICKRGNIIRVSVFIPNLYTIFINIINAFICIFQTFGEVKYLVKYVLQVEGMTIGSDSHRHASIKKPNVS